YRCDGEPLLPGVVQYRRLRQIVGHRGAAHDRRDPGDGVSGAAVLQAGGHGMSTSTVPPVAQAQPPTDSRPKRRPLTAGPGESRANWPIRITLAIVVVGFVIPTLGLFVTSFRTRADATSTSWWGALARFWDTSWTLDSYREVLEAGMGNAFINSLVLT